MHRAISSAVEHLPYKQIVTGSIPVSPIGPFSYVTPVDLRVFMPQVERKRLCREIDQHNQTALPFPFGFCIAFSLPLFLGRHQASRQILRW